MSPAEQIADFVRRHPGEWQAIGRRCVPGGAHDVPDGASLSTEACYIALTPGIRGVAVGASCYGYEVVKIGAATGRPDLLTRIADRVADACQVYGTPAEGLPPWLADPVRRELRRRAGELLTLAGSSPADVVSAAETLDEHLLTRPPVEPTFSGVTNALMEIGMSCRWVADPAEPWR